MSNRVLGKRVDEFNAPSLQHSYSYTQLEGELAQLARAPALHAGGQGFDSLILHIVDGLILKKQIEPKTIFAN